MFRFENFKNCKIFQGLSKMFNNFYDCNLVTKVFNVFKKTDDSYMTLCNVCCEILPSKNFIQCQSNHYICKKCVTQISKTHIYSLSYETIKKGFPCPNYNCQDHLSYDECAKFLPKKCKRQIQSKINEAMLMKAGIQFEKCRKCDCLSEIFDGKIFNCPHCFHKFCFSCNRKCNCNHNYDKCVKTVQKRNDELTEALIHKCHRCQVPFLKIDGRYEGCNEMTCKCGATQCYNCREPIYSRHNCSGKKLSAQVIHDRDVANAKIKQFVNILF